jgi:hypothetical protein
MYLWQQTLQDKKDVLAVFDTANGGKPLVAWGTSSGCYAVLSLFRDQMLGVMLGDDSIYYAALYWGAPGKVAQQTVPDVTFKLSGPFGAFGGAVLGDGAVAWTDGFVHMMSLMDKVPFPVKTDPAAEGGNPHFVGQDLFFGANVGGLARVWARHPQGAVEQVLAPPGQGILTYGVDAVDLAWVQVANPVAGMTDTYGTCDLYTSPFATSAATLAPTRLGSISLCAGKTAWGDLQVHGGFAGLNQRPERVYKLSDGSYVESPPLPFPSTTLGNMLWADGDELITEVLDVPYLNRQTIIRWKLSSLTWNPPEP